MLLTLLPSLGFAQSQDVQRVFPDIRDIEGADCMYPKNKAEADVCLDSAQSSEDKSPVVYLNVYWGALMPGPTGTPDCHLINLAAAHLDQTADAPGTGLALRLMATDPNGRSKDNRGHRPPKWMSKDWTVKLKKKRWALALGEEHTEVHGSILAAHRAALEGLRSCSNETPVAWVEVGLHGFWGEWHYDDERFVSPKKQQELVPPTSVRHQIIRDVTDIFHDEPSVITFDAFQKEATHDPEHELLVALLEAPRPLGIRSDDLGNQDAHFVKVLRSTLSTAIEQGILSAEDCSPESSGGELSTDEGTCLMQLFPGPWGGEFQPKTTGQLEQTVARIDALVGTLGMSFLTGSGYDIWSGKSGTATEQQAAQQIGLTLSREYNGNIDRYSVSQEQTDTPPGIPEPLQ